MTKKDVYRYLKKEARGMQKLLDNNDQSNKRNYDLADIYLTFYNETIDYYEERLNIPQKKRYRR